MTPFAMIDRTFNDVGALHHEQDRQKAMHSGKRLDLAEPVSAHYTKRAAGIADGVPDHGATNTIRHKRCEPSTEGIMPVAAHAVHDINPSVG